MVDVKRIPFILINILIVSLFFLQSCKEEKYDKIEIEFYRMYAKHMYKKVVTFNSDEIKIIDWENQIFEMMNTEKVALVDSIYQYQSALNAYLNVKNDGELLYQVNVIPLAASSYYNYKLPYLFIHKNGLVFEKNSISFYLKHHDVDPNVIGKIKRIGIKRMSVE